MNRNLLGTKRASWYVIALLVTGACSNSDDVTAAEEGAMETDEQAVVSKEVVVDADAIDPQALLERSNESPMKELESVDDVLLSVDEQQEAEEAAAEQEQTVKDPSAPKKD